jgi:site-specific recombinase XerD
MTKDLAGPWVRRFLIEYVIAERNYSSNTQHSYRDMFRLFLPFAAKRSHCTMEQLPLARIQPKMIREFTKHLEQVRHCGSSTINQRLTALRAWASFVGTNSPEQLEWSRQVQTVHLKKHLRGPMNYLEKEEMNALLAAPDQRDAQGFRDYTLLLFLYNTGARASEASHLRIEDLDLLSAVATLHGKGRKARQCPLWKLTATTLRRLVGNRTASQEVFVNRYGQPLTRYGIHTLVKRHTRRAAVTAPTLRTKRVSPHTIRHATAMSLLRSGVDINTIRIWLGHVSLQTTHIYAESDLKMKAQALARCEAPLLHPGKKLTAQKGLMGFLTMI